MPAYALLQTKQRSMHTGISWWLMLENISAVQMIYVTAATACNSRVFLSGAALGATAKEAAAFCPEQLSRAKAPGQAGTPEKQTAPDQQAQTPPVKRRLLLPPTLLPSASVTSDSGRSPDMSRPPTTNAAAAGDTAADPMTAALQGQGGQPASPTAALRQAQNSLHLSPTAAHQQSAPQRPRLPGVDGVRMVSEQAAEPDKSLAPSLPLRPEQEAASATVPVTSVEAQTTAAPAAEPVWTGTYAGAGEGFRWRFDPDTSKLLVEADASVMQHSGQIDAAFAHVAQAVKGLPSVLKGRAPVAPVTACVGWSSQATHATATQPASAAEVRAVIPLSLLARKCSRAVIQVASTLYLLVLSLSICHCYHAALCCRHN